MFKLESTSEIVVGLRGLSIPGVGIDPIIPEISDIRIPREQAQNFLDKPITRTVKIGDEGVLTVTCDFKKIKGLAESLAKPSDPLHQNTVLVNFDEAGSASLTGFTGGSVGGCFEVTWD